MDSLEAQVTEIQMLYPRIYMACHVEHTKARSSEVQLSARDSSILAHLSVKEFTRPGTLAKHLDVAPSTLSEALHNLASLGYVSSKTDQDDERRTEFKLTPKGIAAMKSASVLDSQKVAAILDRLAPEQRVKAIDGLRMIADAAIGFQQ
jgi:DNA-binding MarR family transcriptional regulator